MSVIHPQDVPDVRNDRSPASQNGNDNFLESRDERQRGSNCTESSLLVCSLWNCFGMTPVCQKSGVAAAIREDVTSRGGGPRRRGGGSGGGMEMKGGHILKR